jgi:hypothetical protein
MVSGAVAPSAPGLLATGGRGGASLNDYYSNGIDQSTAISRAGAGLQGCERAACVASVGLPLAKVATL